MTGRELRSPEGYLNMQKNELYMALNGNGLWTFQGRNRMPEMKMGRPARRPISKWLDLLQQVSAAWLQLEGKKPWRRCIPDRPEIQQENRSLGSLASKALTALAGQCFPVASLPVSGVTGSRPEVRGMERIGGRGHSPIFASS